jgi:hypothetical protein
VKLLYVATRGEGATTISVEAEIAKLEQLFSISPVNFTAVASMTAEQLPQELSRREFDVLHVTAHGEGDALQALTDRGGTVLTWPEQIAAFLLPHRRLELIYLNACDSDAVARELTQMPNTSVRFAIGNTAPVASDYSIRGALDFYGRMLLGGSVSEAAGVARQIVQLLSSNRASVTLHSRDGEDPGKVRLVPEPQILAALPQGLRKGKKLVEVMFGVRGAPESMLQVVFFSDDDTLCDLDGTDTLGEQLCAVARGLPSRNGSIWCDRKESWDVGGDFRLFAVGVTADGRRWTASSSLCEALRVWHFGLTSKDAAKLPKGDFEAAMNMLATWNEPKVSPGTGRPRRRRR